MDAAVTTRTLAVWPPLRMDRGYRVAYSSLSRSKQDRLFADALRFLFSPTRVLILMLGVILFQALRAASAQTIHHQIHQSGET